MKLVFCPFYICWICLFCGFNCFIFSREDCHFVLKSAVQTRLLVVIVMMMMMMKKNVFLYCFVVSQHKLFNEHLVSASGNPALVMRRKKHAEKEVHAHLISVVSVRLREGYTIREINLNKGKQPSLQKSVSLVKSE